MYNEVECTYPAGNKQSKLTLDTKMIYIGYRTFI